MKNNSEINITDIKPLVWKIVETIEDSCVIDEKTNGITSGFQALDKITGVFYNMSLDK